MCGPFTAIARGSQVSTIPLARTDPEKTMLSPSFCERKCTDEARAANVPAGHEVSFELQAPVPDARELRGFGLVVLRIVNVDTASMLRYSAVS